MPTPERALSRNDLLRLDTPPLADVGGKASLDRAKLPPYLAGVAERILEEHRGGEGSAGIAIIMVRKEQERGLLMKA